MCDGADRTAFCGLYCGDCIPSNARLFELLEELSEFAAELHLDSYAGLISQKQGAFKDYPVFENVLSQLAALRCPNPCRSGGGRSKCPIRECALEKGLGGCWECPERRECSLLDPLRGFHGGTIDGNLDAIAERGTEGWPDVRGKHYPWSQDRTLWDRKVERPGEISWEQCSDSCRVVTEKEGCDG